MSERAETVEIEQKARKMGWLPKEEFRGKEEHWVDAEKYVQRGEEFIPFLQADRRRLEGELTEVRGQLGALQTTLKEATETIDALKEFRSELNKERVEELRDNLVEGIAQAREAGDVRKEEQLREKLQDAKVALKEPEKTKEPPPVDAQAQAVRNLEASPEWQGFLAENPWFKTDPVMAAAANALGSQLAAEGKLNGLTQAQRLAAIAKATREKFHMDEEPRRTSRVEGGTGGEGRRESTSGDEKTFNDLPPDVKEASKRFEDRLVGKKKGQFPDLASYRKHYAAEYFKRN